MSDTQEKLEKFGDTLAAGLKDNPELAADLLAKGLIRPTPVPLTPTPPTA